MNIIDIYRPKINPQNKRRASNDSREYIPKEYKNFAQALETQFSELMLKEMNKTVSRKNQDTANSYYNNLLTTERAKKMSKNETSQIQKMILKEIYPSHLRNQENFNAYIKRQKSFYQNKIKNHELVGPKIGLHQKEKKINLE